MIFATKRPEHTENCIFIGTLETFRVPGALTNNSIGRLGILARSVALSLSKHSSYRLLIRQKGSLVNLNLTRMLIVFSVAFLFVLL